MQDEVTLNYTGKKEDQLYLNLFDSQHDFHLHVVTLIEQINAACT